MPRLWLICLCSHVIKSCKSFSQPTFNSKSPYYFQKVVWSLSFDYFLPGSTLYVPCVTSSFIHLFFFFLPPLVRIWIWKCCLSKYGGDVSLCRRIISSTFHHRTSCDGVLGFWLSIFFFFFFPPLLKHPSRCWWCVWLLCNYSDVEL